MHWVGQIVEALATLNDAAHHSECAKGALNAACAEVNVSLATNIRLASLARLNMPIGYFRAMEYVAHKGVVTVNARRAKA